MEYRDTEYRDFDASIRELRRMLPDKPRPIGKIVEEACRENLRRYPHPERSTFKKNARPHTYGADDTVICNGRFGRLVFAEMLKDGACSAPTLSHTRIYTGKVETLAPFHDMIVRIVDDHDRAVYNVTLPKHIFFPGFVKLVVREDATNTVVAVSGGGTGNWMTPNTLVGPGLFKTLLGTFLVPSVERHLKLVRGSSR